MSATRWKCRQVEAVTPRPVMRWKGHCRAGVARRRAWRSPAAKPGIADCPTVGRWFLTTGSRNGFCARVRATARVTSSSRARLHARVRRVRPGPDWPPAMIRVDTSRRGTLAEQIVRGMQRLVDEGELRA